MTDRITFNPNQCGGRPCILGMRIRVKDVLDFLAAGVPQAEILEDFPYLELDDIKTCPVIVWLRVGNTSRRALLEWFEPLIPQLETLIAQGDRLVEVR